MTLFYELSIGQNQFNNTRVGIVSFASNAKIEAELTKFQSFSDLENDLLTLSNIAEKDDNVVDVEA